MKIPYIDSKPYDNKFAEALTYYTIYGRIPPVGVLPSFNNNTIEIEGLNDIDEHLTPRWIHVLNNIPNIEILSTCEGHCRDLFMHIIFKITNNKLDLEKIYNNLSLTGKYLKTTKISIVEVPIGQCFVISGYNWWMNNINQNKKWFNWWTHIIPHIHFVVNPR